jgi:RNA polymerase Rpb2
MAKQTMGTAALALAHRTDTKLYRITTPQAPMIRPLDHNIWRLDDYPNGTNAVVAVRPPLPQSAPSLPRTCAPSVMFSCICTSV